MSHRDNEWRSEITDVVFPIFNLLVHTQVDVVKLRRLWNQWQDSTTIGGRIPRPGNTFGRKFEQTG